ncbi:MAG: beta-ketoacyl-ACP synthase II [Clostridiales bacterium]|nr:beta-ketoacyl-ACP synthase II [Clostridiales bacterium]
METRRVVITGMGAITPLGNSVEEFWNGLKEGRNGIGPITKVDVSDFKVKLAGEVKGFDPLNYMEFKPAKRMGLFSQYAVAATKEAIEDSGLDTEKEDPYRIGVIVGCGIGCMQKHEKEIPKFLAGEKLDPMYIPLVIANMASANIAIRFGLKGKNMDVSTACATGTHCIGEAYNSIRLGEADVMIAGGTEAAITATSIRGFAALTALTSETDPDKASRPFDKDRSGFVLGEGAGILVLEEYGHAVKRGAPILAEISGYGVTNDAYHITSPSPDGSGAGTAMKIAMTNAGLNPTDIDYINAHGTSTHHNDLFETRAVKYALGPAAKSVSINSTKSMTGHLLGGAGAIEAIVCVKAILESYVHVTRNSFEGEDELDLDYTFGRGKTRNIDNCMSNSLGFGGHNASLIFSKVKA